MSIPRALLGPLSLTLSPCSESDSNALISSSSSTSSPSSTLSPSLTLSLSLTLSPSLALSSSLALSPLLISSSSSTILSTLAPSSSSQAASAIPTEHSASSSVRLAKVLPATLVPVLVILVATLSIILWKCRRARVRVSHASEVNLLGQSMLGANLNAPDFFAIRRMQHNDAPPPSSLQPMQSTGASSFSMSRERLLSGKSTSHALSQEPSFAETEYLETLPPPYVSEVGGLRPYPR